MGALMSELDTLRSHGWNFWENARQHLAQHRAWQPSSSGQHGSPLKFGPGSISPLMGKHCGGGEWRGVKGRVVTAALCAAAEVGGRRGRRSAVGVSGGNKKEPHAPAGRRAAA